VKLLSNFKQGFIMQLGQIAKGIVRSVRYFRGSKIIQNKNGQVGLEINPKGGITFLFEINYNLGQLLFTTAINRETERFSASAGKLECARKIALTAQGQSEHIHSIAFDPHRVENSSTLIEQVYLTLQEASESGELKEKAFLRTLFKRMNQYASQNEAAEAFAEEAIPGYIQKIDTPEMPAANDHFEYGAAETVTTEIAA